jgi:hypothetical protein
LSGLAEERVRRISLAVDVEQDAGVDFLRKNRVAFSG